MAEELINKILIDKFNEYVMPRYHFNYMFFEWVKPWPYWGMVVHFSLTIFAGFAVAFNYHYRIFSVILFLGYISLFLMESAFYINHFYLYCLISFWMMFLPLDKNQKSAPAWMLYLILFHIALAYFFGGVAKLNPDWLSGTPMNIFLSHRKNYPLGFIYKADWAPYLFSYAGVLFDLLIVPMLLIKQTRKIAFVLSIFFHVSNVMMFGLATFPWFSLLMTTMFFDPSWPRKIPLLRKFMPWGLERPQEFRLNPGVVAVLSVYLMVHLALPFRHLLYPGNTNWTENGHMFSWRMMLRSKTGEVIFFVQRPKNQHMKVEDVLNHITKRQYQDMVGKPDMILQFAHYLRDYYLHEMHENVSVYASSRISLNGRPKYEMIEPGMDLAKQERTLTPYPWVRPLPQSARESIVQQ
jgi:vitamin K-dependent gamma-carboxylase